jgi:predicted CXXCH cytochrome family protein
MSLQRLKFVTMMAVAGAIISVAAVLIIEVALPLRPGYASVDDSALPISTPDSAVTFVGARACAQCHQREFKLWMGSHHQLAMQPANASAVLGNFKDVAVTHGSIRTLFFHLDGKFMVRTDGPDRGLHDYPIKFTFGVSPLQQYLIELPGGRLQALGIAWDSRPRASGGQRWVDLYPDPKLNAVGGPLHWTALGQNWNFMCADCHSTNLRKNYHLDTRTFATTYAEVDVACEACHGPGSRHVAWAAKRDGWHEWDATHGLLIALDERKGISWTINPATGNAIRSTVRTSEREIQLCARCHSRRSQIHEDFVHGQPAGDDYRISLLDEDLYYSDGQIKDEVYEYGSFVQSKMFHAGVTCSDCHDPHSLALRAQGNRVCLQCHAASKYDCTQHHFHRVGSPGSHCVECHMSTRTYMIVDARRDHSLRIPRPDLSVKFGVPNACNECHRDKTFAWAAALVFKSYGHVPTGFQQFAETLQAGQIGAPDAQQLLTQLIAAHGQPAIARATAGALLTEDPSSLAGSSMGDASRDPSALVRRAAAGALDGPSLRDDSGALLLLNDRVRAVRIEAAEALAGNPTETLPGDVAAALAKATTEYIAAQELNADRPEAHVNLALLFAKERHFDEARKELETAQSLDPFFAPAAVNLADLDRALGHDADGERVLREAIVRSPDDASLQYALGLALVRQGQKLEALGYLSKAVRLDPANPRLTYVYAVALNDNGQTEKALDVLENDIAQHPFDRDALAALIDYYRADGKFQKASAYAKRLSELENNEQSAE